MSAESRESLPGIWRIDVLHPLAGKTCCYLLIHQDEAALIDCGAQNGIPAILSTVAAVGLAAEQIKWIIPTHVHLDHAGATGALSQHFPNATVGGHADTIKHLLSPHDKLLSAVRTLYGDKFYTEHYGEVVAIAAARAKILADNETIMVGGRQLTILHTPGHAWHHLSVYDASGGVFFAGDAYGVSFADVNQDAIFIAPVMPPTQFNPPAARQTLRRLQGLDAEYAALAHFDIIKNSAELADRQIAILDEWEAAANNLSPGDKFYTQFRRYLHEWYQTAANFSAEKVTQYYSGDIHLTASGYAHWRNKSPFPLP